MIGKTIRQYRILDAIKPGKGGMGDLYLAEHVSLPKRFAIKCLKPALTQDPLFHKRFLQEANEQALLDHPNIVQAIDLFEEDGQFYFVMEYVEGEDLDSLIRKKGKLPEKQALTLFEGILQGLRFAHSKGIIHRDIKPSNVLIDKSGRPRITDFGIAVLAGGERLTATGTAIGTPWYMSPEQIRHPKNIDRRSDIYSAGIVLYEMLTGDVPFDGETDFSVKEQQVHSPVPDPRRKNPAITEALASIVKMAMAKKPDDRFNDCTAFLDAVESYRQDAGGAPGRRPIVAAIIALVLALVVIVVVLRAIWTAPPADGGDEKALQKTAFILIRDASERASIICRELEEIALKKKNLRIANNLGKTSYADAYAKDVGERENKVARLNAEYRKSIEQLAEIPGPIVDEQFYRYTDTVLQEHRVAQIVYIKLVGRHYRQFQENPNAKPSIMREICAPKK